MTLADFGKYSENPNSITNSNTQIKRELDYIFAHYNLKKAMYLSYDRTAFYQKDNIDFRATFDSNVLARNYDLDLEKGSYGIDILGKDLYILEIKTLGSIPMWFVKVINKLGIKPGNFSKYGEAYEQIIMNKQDNKIVEYSFKQSNVIEFKRNNYQIARVV